MRQLDDPTLRECVRLVERHPDITGAYKVRLLNGLNATDVELAEGREAIAAMRGAAAQAGKKR